MRLFILLLSLTFLSASTASFAKIYTWKDKSGRTIYGDNPPQNKKAKIIVPKELTIVPGFKDPSLEPQQEKVILTEKENDETNKEEEDEEISYESFTIIYPTAETVSRANDGSITAAFALTPELKEPDTISVYLDGKKVVEGSKSLGASFTNLDRGSHSLFAVIRNTNGDVLLNSNTVSFQILRNSIIRRPRR